MVMFYAVMVLCLSSTALAQVIGFGPCPKIDTIEDFDILKIQEKWYEARRYFTTFEAAVKCVTLDITEGGNGTMLIEGSAIYSITGHLGISKDIALRVADPSEPGKLLVKAPSSDVWSNMWILGTDYESYIVGYNCADYTFINKKFLWIFTRDQEPKDAIVDEAIKILEKQKLDKNVLVTTDQKKCDVQP